MVENSRIKMRTLRPAKKTSSIKISTKTYYKVRRIAEKNGRLLQDVLTEAVEQYCKRMEGKNGR